MLGFLQEINNNYAGLLSFLSSLIMVVVTIIYVWHTRRQANYAKESMELVAKQIKTSKQPCIVPSVIDSHGSAFDATEYTRIQLGFDICLKNVGDAPAINIYSLASIELQLSSDISGNKKTLSAALLPHYVQALFVGEEKTIHMHFETSEVNALIRELSKSMEMNEERIKTNPSQHHYVGALLVIQVLCKNTMGQWCESRITYEIPWLEFLNPLPRETHNINENTIPPKRIQCGDMFRATLCASHLAPFSYKMTTDENVKKLLKPYIDVSPWLLEAVKRDLPDLELQIECN